MNRAAFGVLGLACLALAQPASIEERGSRRWPTSNHFRFAVTLGEPGKRPVLVAPQMPDQFNPDSVRVYGPADARPIPCKTEGRRPEARFHWISVQPGTYYVYFDLKGRGETQRLPEPAMVGSGDRVSYGREGVRDRLAVGLWAYPAAVDVDGDGDLDLIVSCTDRPYNGTYLFENIGGRQKPLFDRAEWLGRGIKDLVAADFNGDGKTDLVTSGGYHDDFVRNRLSRFVPVKLSLDYWVGRDDLWYPVDWDGDGITDLLVGVSDWRDYGWDDGYDEQGRVDPRAVARVHLLPPEYRNQCRPSVCGWRTFASRGQSGGSVWQSFAQSGGLVRARGPGSHRREFSRHDHLVPERGDADSAEAGGRRAAADQRRNAAHESVHDSAPGRVLAR
jgi:hypothetical protein